MAAAGSVVPPGLVGCMADVVLEADYRIDLLGQASQGQNIDYC